MKIEQLTGRERYSSPLQNQVELTPLEKALINKVNELVTEVNSLKDRVISTEALAAGLNSNNRLY